MSSVAPLRMNERGAPIAVPSTRTLTTTLASRGRSSSTSIA